RAAALGLEGLAGAGEVLAGTRTAGAWPAGSIGAPREDAWLLLQEAADWGALANGGPPPDGPPLDELVPPPLRRPLEDDAIEAEHRHATVAFVKFTGADALVADIDAAAEQFDELACTV